MDHDSTPEIDIHTSHDEFRPEQDEEEGIFSEDSKESFQLSKGSLNKTASRAYRKRDKESYGDSRLGEIDHHRRESRKNIQSEERKPHHDNSRQLSKKQESRDDRHRRYESDRKNLSKHRDHREREGTRLKPDERRRHVEKRSRSRSPRQYNVRSQEYLDHGKYPRKSSHGSIPPSLMSRLGDLPSGSDERQRMKRTYTERHRETDEDRPRGRDPVSSDSDTELSAKTKKSSNDRDINILINDLKKSSTSSSDSESEGEIKDVTPVSSKSETTTGGDEKSEVKIKRTWKDVSSESESDEYNNDQYDNDEDIPPAESIMEEEPVQPSIEPETSSHDNEVIKEPSPSTSLPMETVEENKESHISPIETKPDTPESPEDELPLYLPALMGCRSVESYEWLNRIEEGTYGVVFRAKDKRTGEIVALKKLKMEKEREGFPITSLREINMLLKAKHDNIVFVREIVVGSNMDKIFIVMDYVEHDLKSLMETMKQPFLEGEVKTLLIQLLRAVHHLHDNWILHRDLKTSNLLLSHKGILKVADFGLAREYGSPLKKYTPIVVTLWYRAPELLLGAKEYSTAVDVWSVGCIFAELLQHKPLFMGKSEIDQLNQIFKELGTPNDSIWPGFSELPIAKKVEFTKQPLNNLRKRFPMITKCGFNLLNKFLAYDPKRRIVAEEALKHEYFEESPLPVDPSMFPTWPAKSEMVKKSARHRSPTAPEGGAFLLQQKGKEDEEKFHLTTAQEGKASVGPGFTLKF